MWEQVGLLDPAKLYFFYCTFEFCYTILNIEYYIQIGFFQGVLSDRVLLV